MAPLYTTTPFLHGIREIHDEDGEVASFHFDERNREWVVCANINRFATKDSLPPVFGRYCTHRFEHIADVYRMFGIPLPGIALVAEAQSARAA